MEDGVREGTLSGQKGCRASDACSRKAEQGGERENEGIMRGCGNRLEENAAGSFGGDSKEGPNNRPAGSGLVEMIAAAFPGKRQDIRTYSGLTLAYIGDVVYDLIIRTAVVEKGNRPVNDLHRITVKHVSAPAQAKMVQALEGQLTEEEKVIFRRGKNSKPHTVAKNASVSDYLKATGFEAVIGYLYLTDDWERILELVKKGIELAGMEI